MRRRHFVASSVVSVLFVLLACQALPAEDAVWKVGTAKAKITPEKLFWMAGYGARDRPAEGTLHDLWIKVLVLQAGDDRPICRGHTGVVVASDLLGWPKGMYERVCAELKTRCELERSQIMLTATHTHTGPVLRDALYDIYPLDDRQRALIEEYSAALEKTAVATVVKALSELSPATLWAAEGSTNFAVNRRNNPQAQVGELLARGTALKGPVDHDVPVLAVRTPRGGLRAVVFGYACHTTTLSSYGWSGDYAGFAQIELEQSHPETLAMFRERLQGFKRPLDLWVVVYDHQNMEGCQEHLAHCDVLSYWSWKASDLTSLEERFRGFVDATPGKRRVLGCYMWDYGQRRPMEARDMEHQCELGLKWLREGDIEGMILLASCICDLDLEAVEWTREWVAKVGGEEL